MSERAEAAARFLIACRAPGAVLPDALPDDLRPRDEAEMIAIHMATMRALGPIGGWKVGVSDAAALPMASPLPASGIVPSPASVASRLRCVEAEISFTFGRALPATDRPYDRAEIMAAIASCQAAIEIVDPRFRSREALDAVAIRADLSLHGGLVVGAPIAAWRPEMFAALPVTLTIDGAVRRQSIGSNPGAPDLIRLLVWLANSDGARAAGGIDAGSVVTTGSWTGLELVGPGGSAVAQFDGFAPVAVRF